MKFLTTNFIQCAVKSCASSGNAFPLHFKADQLVQQDVEFEKEFIINMLPRLDWSAILSAAADLGNTSLPPAKPDTSDLEENEQLVKDLHNLLLETQIIEGEMQCSNCHHIYYIKNSIPNFLLPAHLA